MNVYKKDAGSRLFPPYAIKQMNGVGVAIFGIACNIVDKTMPPAYSESLRFTDGREELPIILFEIRSRELADDNSTIA